MSDTTNSQPETPAPETCSDCGRPDGEGFLQDDGVCEGCYDETMDRAFARGYR